MIAVRPAMVASPAVVKTDKPKAKVVAPVVEAPKPILDKANELLTLKGQQENINLRVTQIKNELKPYVKLNPIKTANGNIYYVIGTTSKYIDKNKLRQAIVNQLHISIDVADQVINSGSVEKIIQPYIKVLTV